MFSRGRPLRLRPTRQRAEAPRDADWSGSTELRYLLTTRLKNGTADASASAGAGADAGVATPTTNSQLPFRLGGFACLAEALDYAARGETGLNFFDSRGRLVARLSYADLRVQALRFARRLVQRGARRADRMVIVADTWPGFCVAFMGAQYAGVIAVPVAVPAGLGAKATYIDQLRRQIAGCDAIGVVVPDDLVDLARQATADMPARFVATLAAIEAWPQSEAPLAPLAGDEGCYIQFSSGSTRQPLGVDIRQDRLMANIDASIARQGLNAQDAGVSWLPLYHDMGLIGFFLAPLCAQRSVDLMAPGDFARRPMTWLSLISRRRATITYSPSFGYELVTRRAQNMPEGLDLSSLQLAGIGADMIQPDVLRRFADAFAARGFDARAFLPSYGMAEVCVGLSMGSRMEGVSSVELAGRTFVACGHPLAGHDIEIRNDRGEVLTDGAVGRIFVRGPSVMPGYFERPDESRAVLREGWLDSGDLGCWRDGRLVITGRAKDLIIVNGRNIWPQDIEWSLETLPRLRRGDACAFSIDDATGARVVVLIQSYPGTADDLAALAAEAKQRVRECAGIDGTIVLISRKVGLPLTSSGKLSRTAARTRYLDAALGGPPVEGTA